ncbi:MAG: hypothetical protein Q8M73_06455, partial [Actinomycetota bacterium]|nr:hypothetical protein [Actinomycetota bacterium]
MKVELLKQVVKFYLSSGDFNGFYINGSSEPLVLQDAEALVMDGLVQVVATQDHLNTHIRPWASRRTKEEQAQSIRDMNSRSVGVCLYPTPLALRGVRVPRRLSKHPFGADMAKGRGTLELAYFEFDVLEQYRNDARYNFTYWDFGVDIGISDEAYMDDDESNKDHISLAHVGFAYDLSEYDINDLDSIIVRRVAAFYGDLAKLTPEHQQRWKSYQVADDNLEPHPVWWGSQMGHWPDGSGPFESLFAELRKTNELSTRIWNEPLFAHADRPEDLGWILRPSQREWDEFVSNLDKVLSENIRH